MARSRQFISFFLLCSIVLKLLPHAGPATEDVNGLQEKYSLSRELQGGGNSASSSHFPPYSSNLFSGAQGDVQYCCCCATSLDVADPESFAGYKNSAVGHAGESRNDFFFFNHFESQPNVNRLLGKAVKWLLLPAKKTPSCQQWKVENISKQELQKLIVEPKSRVVIFFLFWTVLTQRASIWTWDVCVYTAPRRTPLLLGPDHYIIMSWAGTEFSK